MPELCTSVCRLLAQQLNQLRVLSDGPLCLSLQALKLYQRQLKTYEKVSNRIKCHVLSIAGKVIIEVHSQLWSCSLAIDRLELQSYVLFVENEEVLEVYLTVNLRYREA
jgi:hypothetical protein